MKLQAWISALTVLAMTGASMAQDGDKPRPERRDGQGQRERGERGQRDRGNRGPGERGPGQSSRGQLPIVTALDSDGNGELSAEEINNAVAALKTLDKNSDGVLDMSEMMPPRREGGGPGGPPGMRGQGGPGGPGMRGQGGPGGPGGGFNMEERFKQMDKDGDGKISKDEAPERMKQGFDRIDTNKDGYIDDAEIKQMFERFRSGMRRGGAPGEGGNRPERPSRPE